MSREARATRSVAMAIMAKVPQAGEVKTRLCPPLSPSEAAQLYRCFLLDKIEQVRRLPDAEPAIAYAPAEGRAVFRTMAPGFILVPQRGDDLGGRLHNGLSGFLSDGYGGALFIDSDTPTLPREFLGQAVALIGKPEVDVVLGPSEDGGYYLVGLRAPQPALFENMAWSTPEVLPETMRRARARGLAVASLPTWFDVDTGEDLERLRRALADTPGPEPQHTRRFFLERHK